ncbi:MAG: redoxin domain-containing protein [Verrucomicrobiota bacterium]
MKTFWALGMAAMVATGAQAADLGIAAPPLQIAHWMKGQPVDLAAAKGRNIIVVEFWATWCGPCVEGIPHLTEMQKKFKDQVRFVGITDEEPKEVQAFLKKMGAKMDYTVAIDKEKQSFANYMKAFGAEGIPHSFVVDKSGIVAWEGHPMEGLEEVLQQMVKGTYDLKAVKEERALHSKVHEYLRAAAHGDKSPVNQALGRQLLKDGAKHPDLLNELAWGILTEQDFEFRDKSLALEAAKAANDATGGKSADIIDTYALALFENGNAAEAVKWQKQAVALCDDKEMLAKLKERLAKYEQKAGAK